MDISGTIVPMATPIDGDGIDEAALEEFTRSLVDGGVHGLFPGSSIGEFPSLTADQHCTLVETVVEAADDSTTVIAGCCATSIGDVRARISTAAAAGADAAVVVTPYYLSTTQDGLRRFFERVAADSPLELLLYNIPALTGNELAVDTVFRLADLEAVVGLKDTSGDLGYQHRILEGTPPEFSVFQGSTDIAAAALNLGADGLIAGPANVFPDELAELYEAHARGDDATVNRIFREVVVPLVSTYDDIPTAAAIKHLLRRDGHDVGDPLPPVAPVSAAEAERLDAAYRTVVDRRTG
ncbi:MAG: dihydrodipicolinate synthase family protein [Haloferacaceae archaeon]